MTPELEALFAGTSGPELLTLMEQVDVDEELDVLLACKVMEEIDARPDSRVLVFA